MLIDAGCGVDKFQNTNGRLLGHLTSAGYAPGDSDMILFTPLHCDHLWGISDGKNGSLVFPSAEFVASETEVAFWSDPALPSKVSAKQQPAITQTNLKLASPRLRQIKAGAEVAPGVTTVDTAGHTPGHMSVHISSGSEEMLLTGDVVVDTAISFQHPEWTFGMLKADRRVDYDVAGEEHLFAAGTDMHRHVAWRVTGGVDGGHARRHLRPGLDLAQPGAGQFQIRLGNRRRLLGGHFAGQCGFAPQGDLGLAGGEFGRREQQRRVLAITDTPQAAEMEESEQDHGDTARV